MFDDLAINYPLFASVRRNARWPAKNGAELCTSSATTPTCGRRPFRPITINLIIVITSIIGCCPEPIQVRCGKAKFDRITAVAANLGGPISASCSPKITLARAVDKWTESVQPPPSSETFSRNSSDNYFAVEGWNWKFTRFDRARLTSSHFAANSLRHTAFNFWLSLLDQVINSLPVVPSSENRPQNVKLWVHSPVVGNSMSFGDIWTSDFENLKIWPNVFTDL